MTKISKTIFTLIFAALFSSCSKSSDSSTPTPTTPTTLKVTVTDDAVNKVAGASVDLYLSELDLLNKSNVVATTSTDALGVATFTSIGASKYWVLATSGCQTNYNAKANTGSAIVTNTVNSVITQMQKTGTLKMVNTSSNPYKVYVNGVETIASQLGGTTINLTSALNGNYTIRVLQLSGYAVIPTDKTYTGTLSGCGSTLTTTYP